MDEGDELAHGDIGNHVFAVDVPAGGSEGSGRRNQEVGVAVQDHDVFEVRVGREDVLFHLEAAVLEGELDDPLQIEEGGQTVAGRDGDVLAAVLDRPGGIDELLVGGGLVDDIDGLGAVLFGEVGGHREEGEVAGGHIAHVGRVEIPGSGSGTADVEIGEEVLQAVVLDLCVHAGLPERDGGGDASLPGCARDDDLAGLEK